MILLAKAVKTFVPFGNALGIAVGMLSPSMLDIVGAAPYVAVSHGAIRPVVVGYNEQVRDSVHRVSGDHCIACANGPLSPIVSNR
jgi:hypothetical protein